MKGRKKERRMKVMNAPVPAEPAFAATLPAPETRSARMAAKLDPEINSAISLLSIEASRPIARNADIYSSKTAESMANLADSIRATTACGSCFRSSYSIISPFSMTEKDNEPDTA